MRSNSRSNGTAMPAESATDKQRPATHDQRPAEDAVRTLLRHVGEDPDREGLARTPTRVVQAYEYLTSGYSLDPNEVINGALFTEEQYQEIILCRDVDFYSLCEHHLLPFIGKAHVAYLPNRHIVGLSKIPRLVEIYARSRGWQPMVLKQANDTIEMPEFGLVCRVGDLYRNTPLDPRRRGAQ